MAGSDSIELLSISGYYGFQDRLRSQPQHHPLCLKLFTKPSCLHNLPIALSETLNSFAISVVGFSQTNFSKASLVGRSNRIVP